MTTMMMVIMMKNKEKGQTKQLQKIQYRKVKYLCYLSREFRRESASRIM